MAAVGNHVMVEPGDEACNSYIFIPVLMVFLSLHYLQVALETQELLQANGLPAEVMPPALDASSSMAVGRACYETIVRLYYLRHGFEHSDIFGVQYLNIIAFGALKQLKEAITNPEMDEVRSSLILAAKGLHDQGRSWYLPHSVFQLVRNAMSPEDCDILERFANVSLKDEAGDSAMSFRIEYAQSQYPLDLAKPHDTDPDTRRLGNLLKQSMKINQ
jgi:hypothetical protein